MFGACAAAPTEPGVAVVMVEYREAHEEWRQNRIAALQRPEGWLTLIGLHWLRAGSSSFGSGVDNDLVIPELQSLADRPSTLGDLVLEGSRVTLEPSPGSQITTAAAPETVVADRLLLASDHQGGPTELRAGSLSFQILERGGELGVRFRDLESPRPAELGAIPAFALDPKWRFAARFEKAPDHRMVPIPNILGRTYDQPSVGSVVFEHAGETYRLDVIGDDPAESLLLVVGDPTNRVTTYGGGRYLAVEVGADGAVDLDFNRLYNPPCVFTEFATCPLPPPQNRLPFAIEAGEQAYATAAH